MLRRSFPRAISLIALSSLLFTAVSSTQAYAVVTPPQSSDGPSTTGSSQATAASPRLIVELKSPPLAVAMAQRQTSNGKPSRLQVNTANAQAYVNQLRAEQAAFRPKPPQERFRPGYVPGKPRMTRAGPGVAASVLPNRGGGKASAAGPHDAVGGGVIITSRNRFRGLLGPESPSVTVHSGSQVPYATGAPGVRGETVPADLPRSSHGAAEAHDPARRSRRC